MSIEFKNVSYTYSKGTPFSRTGIKGINLKITDGEWVVIMGPTGSGKSTLLQHLNGLLKPESGEVLLDNINIHSSKEALRMARRKVGFVFQYPEHQLFGASVFEEVAYGPENFGYTGADIERRVMEAMTAVGLDYPKYKDRSPHDLSGGEKRRVALAGVLAVEPEVIALDEPTAGLDLGGKRVLLETISRLNREYGKTVIWVTHEITDIALLADRLVVVQGGEIVLEGSPREKLHDPLMTELGIDVPLAVNIANKLSEKGHNINGFPVTIDEIKSEILRLLR